MIQLLSDHDRSRLDALVAETEKKTKTQIILAVIKRSDAYAELPWKAFALGASIAGLSALIIEMSSNAWHTRVPILIAVAGTLACGALLALLTVLIPAFAKRFLSRHRGKVEVQQYAESLFLERELFATSKRTGILVLVSLFERRVILLPDRGLDDRLNESDKQNVIAAMTPLLKRKEIRKAFEAGLQELSRILETTGSGTDENELPDEIIEEKGV